MTPGLRREEKRKEKRKEKKRKKKRKEKGKAGLVLEKFRCFV